MEQKEKIRREILRLSQTIVVLHMSLFGFLRQINDMKVVIYIVKYVFCTY